MNSLKGLLIRSENQWQTKVVIDMKSWGPLGTDEKN